MAPQQVQLTVEELLALGRKQSQCMKIDPGLLQATPCASQTGVSSGAMFSKQVQPRSTGHSHDKTVQQYAQMLGKYYGQGSLIDQMLAKSKAVSDAATIAALDKEIKTRAGRETKAKYLSARMAGQYGVQVAGITGPPPAAPPVLGLTMVPTLGSGPPELATGLGDAHGTERVLELAATMAEADKVRSQQVREFARQADEMQKQRVTRAASARPASAAFRAPTREQGQRTGSRFVEPWRDAPGPGHYNYDHCYSYLDKPQPTTLIVPPNYGAEIKAHTVERKAAHQAQLLAHRSSASGGRQPRSAMRRGSTGDVPHYMRPANAPRPTTGRPLSTMECGGRDRAKGKAEVMEEEKLALFKDAHHVHKKVATPQGTSSFKATTRPHLMHESTASHLLGKYFHDDIDALPQKAKRLVLPFARQPSRPSPGTLADTPAALGPGSYIGMDNMPQTWTGRHVDAGHKGVRKALDFGRTTARPGTAPAMLPAGPLPDVSTEQAQAALLSLFGQDVYPIDLIAVQGLQQRSGVPSAYSPPRSRPASAMQGPGAPRPFSAASYAHMRPTSAAEVASRAAPVVVAATSGRPLSGVHYEQQGATRCGLGQEALQKYSSTGLAKRVPGGHMARTTRDQEIQSLRVIADGKVVPPASAPLTKIRPSQAADVMYDVPDDVNHPIQGHRHRPPSWQLPPNRAAMSKQWVSAAALAYL